MRLQPLTEGGVRTGWIFYCMGCGSCHWFRTALGPQDPPTAPVWTFNGDVDSPTFSPSLVVNRSTPARLCHLFLRNGVIEFLSDCHHDLKNQKIPLQEIP